MEIDRTLKPPTPSATPKGHSAGPAHTDHEEIDLNVTKPGKASVLIAAVVSVVLLGVLLITGLIPRLHQTKELASDAAGQENAAINVNVARPRRAPVEVNIVIPGNLRPWQEVSIFSRTTGYLKKYYVDISEHVEAGQLMADIDSPEIDQELGQNQAALLQAKTAVSKAMTDRDLARVTLNRFVSLKESHSVSLQDLDEKQAALAAAESNLESTKANVAAAEANVRRMTEMKRFERVMAPFSGVCTGRAYDVGSLILANPTATDIKPMFKIAQNDVLRAFVNVPQSAALQIKKGMEAKITVHERPGQIYVGKVMGTTNYLDPMSRSLLTEVKVPNPKEPDGSFSLLPGMYVQVSFTISRDTPPLMVPAPALVTNADGTQLAVLQDGMAHFKKVTLGQDYGTEVEIVSGLAGDEQIIANPGERVVEGATVHPVNTPSAQPTAELTPPREKTEKGSQLTKE